MLNVSKYEGLIEKRVFIVGCPRSGTTLVQSLLASHQQMISFPETHFFTYLSNRNRFLKRLGFVSPTANEHFTKWLIEHGYPELIYLLPHLAINIRQMTRSFEMVFDKLTSENSGSIWIEKTPRHLHFINMILKYITDVRYIHVLRNGPDVVASLFDVTNNYPELWGGARSIDQCIDRWNLDMEISQLYKNDPIHHLTSYERLVENPYDAIKNICDFLEVNFVSNMLMDYAFELSKLVDKPETWKGDMGKKITSQNDTKFYRVFTESQRQYVIKRTAITDYQVS